MLLLRMRDRERKLLSKIDEAFARIDDGATGVARNAATRSASSGCKARPVTTLCIDCKSEQEAREKHALRCTFKSPQESVLKGSHDEGS